MEMVQEPPRWTQSDQRMEIWGPAYISNREVSFHQCILNVSLDLPSIQTLSEMGSNSHQVKDPGHLKPVNYFLKFPGLTPSLVS